MLGWYWMSLNSKTLRWHWFQITPQTSIYINLLFKIINPLFFRITWNLTICPFPLLGWSFFCLQVGRYTKSDDPKFIHRERQSWIRFPIILKTLFLEKGMNGDFHLGFAQLNPLFGMRITGTFISFLSCSWTSNGEGARRRRQKLFQPQEKFKNMSMWHVIWMAFFHYIMIANQNFDI